MKVEVRMCCFRLTLELRWLGLEPDFRSIRLIPREASLRRALRRNVRERLRKATGA